MMPKLLLALLAAATPASQSYAPAHDHFIQLCSEDHRDAVSKGVDVVMHIRHLESLKGFVVEDAAVAAALEDDHRVCGVDKVPRHTLKKREAAAADSERAAAAADSGVSANGWRGDYWYDRSHPEGRPWNLDRINGFVDGDASFERTGRGASIFVLDSGLDTTHPEFDGANRNVENVADFTSSRRKWKHKPEWSWGSGPVTTAAKANNDYDGHGTHCAATAAGVSYGVAPGADLYGMKVLGDDGTGSTLWTLEAMDSVAELVRFGRLGGPAILSMSLGGPCPYSDPIYCAYQSYEARAVADLRRLGAAVVVAAGNEGDDACEHLPAAARGAITVGAIEQGDRISSFSNWGRCVDVMAPGSDIPSAVTGHEEDAGYFIDDETEQYVVQFGTSQATPLVAGTLALYTEAIGGDVDDAINAMINNAVAASTRSPDTCPTNFLVVQTPATGELDFTPLDEPVCPLPGEAPAPPRKTSRPTSRPSSRPSARPSLRPSTPPSQPPSTPPTTPPSKLTTPPTSRQSARPSLPPTSRPPSAQPSRLSPAQPSRPPSAQPSASPPRPTPPQRVPVFPAEPDQPDSADLGQGAPTAGPTADHGVKATLSALAALFLVFAL